MTRRSILALLFVALAAPGAGRTAARQDAALDPAPLERDALAALTGAADIRPGVTLANRFTPENKKDARDYLTSQLKRFGLDPKTQPYGAAGGENVYAVLACGKPGAETVVFGAHYDSVAAGPGANDDGTGVVAVLAVARAIAGVAPRTRDVIFAFFDEEERGLLGSRAFAQMLQERGTRLHSVHTIDQMGWDSNHNRAIELELPFEGGEDLYRHAASVLHMDIPIWVTQETGSDHSSFRRLGDRAIGVTEEYRHNDTTPFIHRAGDTFATIDFDYLASTTKLAIEVMRELVTNGAAGLQTGGQEGQELVVHVPLTYGAPGNGPAPNFSPYGTQVPLTDLAANATLPDGAARPAKTGTVKVGPSERSWMTILVTADPEHPADLCRLYLDRNRNGDFADDGPPLTAAPSQNEKTKAWWSSFAKTELSVPYAAATDVEPYMVSFWAVREGDAPPAIIRYSVASWRAGTATIEGVDALVAVMDSNNDAVFDKRDTWSVLGAAEPDAPKRVLSIAEARSANRLMFVTKDGKDLVLEFRGISPDGRSIDFAVVDRPITKAADRAPDDLLAPERTRARTQTPFAWTHGGFDAATARAKSSGRKLLVDFETTWCGPCKQMDEWIWTDAEVAGLLNDGYLGVKIDGDVDKALVATFGVKGYPTGIILDSTGSELARFVGYQTSKEMLALLTRK